MISQFIGMSKEGSLARMGRKLVNIKIVLLQRQEEINSKLFVRLKSYATKTCIVVPCFPLLASSPIGFGEKM